MGWFGVGYSARHNYTGGGPNVQTFFGHPPGQPKMRLSNSDTWKFVIKDREVSMFCDIIKYLTRCGYNREILIRLSCYNNDTFGSFANMY